MIRRLMAATLVFAAAQPLTAQSFAPRDECRAIPGAEAFRMALATAVANRDADRLLALVAPDVILDFGGGSGPELLRERLTDPDYRLWEQLDEVQRFGCGSKDEGFFLPWVWGEDLGTDEPYDTYLVTDDAVPLRTAPADTAPIVRHLSWDVVILVGRLDEDDDYAEVTAGSTRGYVRWSDLRSQLSYRLLVGAIDGNWRVTAFIAGD